MLSKFSRTSVCKRKGTTVKKKVMFKSVKALLCFYSVLKQSRNQNFFFSTDVEKHVSETDIIFVSADTSTKMRELGAGKAIGLTYSRQGR